jgi:anti-anti-sigma factor
MTMTEPGFPVRITCGVPVVIAPEEIDITNAGQLRAALLRAAARPAAALVADMTRTRFCDSAGLHALIGGILAASLRRRPSAIHAAIASGPAPALRHSIRPGESGTRPVRPR